MPAVLVTAFNRPSKLSDLLGVLRDCEVARLYVVIDGPRNENPADLDLVRETQQVALAATWATDLDVLVREQNLGCGLSPADAIGRTLKKEPRLIIFEDDCQPVPSFFDYVTQGLNHYRDDDKVAAICGTSYVPRDFFGSSDYVWVSRLFSPWGWGTWSRAWHGFSSKAAGWRSRTSLIRRLAMGGYSIRGLRWLQANWAWLEATDPEGVQVWDHLFGLLICERDQVILRPTVNLVKNVGEDGGGTHASPRDVDFDTSVGEWVGNEESWPRALRVNSRADRWVMKNDYQARSTLAWATDVAKGALNLNK